MASINKVILIGRLGKDPEMRFTQSKQAVANFSIATSESWKDKGGQKQEKTEWHNIILWARLAELANEYLHKGSQVYIEGRLQTRSWDDKDGIKHYTTEIIGQNMQFLDEKKNSGDGNGAKDNRNWESKQPDNLPF